MKKIIITIIINIVLILYLPSTVYANTSYNTKDFIVDGDSGEWEFYPTIFTYNWDNSDNCWYYGVWIDGIKYLTPVGEYSNNVRHEIGFYTDEENVYILVIYSKDYVYKVNGDDFNIKFNNDNFKFRVVQQNGEGITNATLNWEPNLYSVKVITINNEIVKNSEAILKVNPNNENNILEIKIPISSINGITKEEIGNMSLFNPNLMYESYAVGGASTNPYLLVIICSSIAIFPIFLHYYKQFENNKNL